MYQKTLGVWKFTINAVKNDLATFKSINVKQFKFEKYFSSMLGVGINYNRLPHIYSCY